MNDPPLGSPRTHLYKLLEAVPQLSWGRSLTLSGVEPIAPTLILHPLRSSLVSLGECAQLSIARSDYADPISL